MRAEGVPAGSLLARLLAGCNGLLPGLARPSYAETRDYQQWLEADGQRLYDQFYSHYTSFADKRVLDLACGQGGKFVAYARQGPRLLCGIDRVWSRVADASAFASRGPGSFVGGDVGWLPFADQSFDVVISDDGFDHFKEPGRVLSEMTRVLAPGGTAFISFVPYYSRHCSHMDEFLRLPWHHVLFAPRTIREALALGARARGLSDEEAERLAQGVFHNFQSDLSRLTLRGFFAALRRTSGLRLVRARRQAPHWRRPLAYVPGLSELFVDSLHCVLRREPGSRISRAVVAREMANDIAHVARALVRLAANGGRRSRRG